MKIKLSIVLLIFVVSLPIAMAHDEGASYQPQPTQPIDNAEAIDDTGTPVTTNVDNTEVSVTPSLFTFDFGSRTLIILLISGGLGIGMTGAMWLMTGRNLPTTILLASFLTVFTGAIHLAFGIRGDFLLLANGIGFMGFAVIRSIDAIRLSKLNKPTILALMGYTIVTFLGYFLTHDHFDTIGLVSKLTEAILFVVLLREIVISNHIGNVVANSSIAPAVE